MKRTYYQILGIDPSASEKEIKQAYHRLAQDLHPDKAESEEERKKNEEIFADVSKAYNVLKDKRKRADYDHTQAKPGKKPPERQRQGKKKTPTELPTRAAARERAKERVQIAKRAFTKGMRIYQTGDYVKAITFFQAAIQNDNSEAIYFARLAVSMMHARKSFAKAVEYCKRAIEIDPYNMDYKLYLGEIYEIAGALSMAKKTYDEILRWDNTNDMARHRLEMLGFSRGKKSKSFFVNIIRRLHRK